MRNDGICNAEVYDSIERATLTQEGKEMTAGAVTLRKRKGWVWRGSDREVRGSRSRGRRKSWTRGFWRKRASWDEP